MQWAVATIGFAGGSGVVGTIVRAIVRRPKTNGQESKGRFQHEELSSPPMDWPAYSDRMAYVLAEMSALAYYRFETTEGRRAEAGV